MKIIFSILLLAISGIMLFGQTVENKEKPILYLYVDTPPIFQGDNLNFRKFINNNIKWPNEFDGQGTVLLSFIITKNGDVSNIKIEKSLCPTCDKEAVRLLKLSPKWAAGKLDDKNVNVLMYIPITFKIEM